MMKNDNFQKRKTSGSFMNLDAPGAVCRSQLWRRAPNTGTLLRFLFLETKNFNWFYTFMSKFVDGF